MEDQVYELSIKAVDVQQAEGGTGKITVTYQGRAEEKTASANFVSDEFRDLFECCQKIAQEMNFSEFRPNDGVKFEFTLVNEEGISIWHTKPNNFLKMPLRMNMDWTCEYLQQNFKSYTTLGVIEIPEELKLVNGRISTPKLAELLIDSMASGLEFIGLMFLQREHMGRQRHQEMTQSQPE